MTSDTRERTHLLVLGALAVLFYAIFILRTAFPLDGGGLGFTLFDDGMISMRYARNLAEGYGLVWNAGEPPVEGYTNPLWTLWMALIHRAGVGDEHASLVVMISGAALLVSTAALSARIAGNLFGSRVVTVSAFALVAFNYAIAFWTLRGMEVGLLAALVTAAIALAIRVERDGGGAALGCLCVVLALADLTRRDAAVLHAVFIAYLAWVLTGRARVIGVAGLAASLAAALGLQLWFSAWYYGDPWPNTYYLKLGGVTLVDRLRRGVPALAIVGVRNLLPAVLAAAFLIRRRDSRHTPRPVVLLGALVAIQGLYSAYVGGDAWEYMGYTNRYLTTIVPALSVLAAAGIGELADAPPAWQLRFMALLAAAVGIRLAFEIVLHAANRGVTRGGALFEAHPALWLAAVLPLAVVLVAGAAVLWTRCDGRWPAPWLPRPAALTLAAAVWVVGNGAPVADWLRNNASSAENDGRGARTGLLVRRLTSEDTVIAVTSAGNVPYFSRRRAIDILGKSDPVIARMPPVNSFVPGHNKWNLDRSIRDGHPDLVWGLPRRAGDVGFLVGLGYRSYPGMCFARPDSGRVDHAGLWRGLETLYPDAPPLTEHADAAGQ